MTIPKVQERNTRTQRFGMAVLGGVAFRWEWKGRGEYALKRWYITMPSWHRPGYIAGPFDTRWEAVDAALRNLGIDDDTPTAREAVLPDAAGANLPPR